MDLLVILEFSFSERFRSIAFGFCIFDFRFWIFDQR